MRKLYSHETSEEIWERYWQMVDKDPDEFEDTSGYPIVHTLDYDFTKGLSLELGCGPGRVLKHYFYRKANIIGLEYNQTILHKLLKENNNIKLLCGDARSLPFQDNTFDRITAFGVYHNFDDLEKSLKEAYRILKPSGDLCFSVACQNIVRLAQQCEKLINYLILTIKNKKLHKLCPCHFIYTPRDVITTALKCKFRSIKITPTSTKMLLWKPFPFLRKYKEKTIKEMRSGDAKFELTQTGEFLYSLMSKFKWHLCFYIIFQGKK